MNPYMSSPVRRQSACKRLRTLLLMCVMSSCMATSAQALIISEVLFDPVAFGSDAGLEYVELFNDTGSAVDLADWSLGWGGADYTFGTLDLDPAGVLAAGQYVVIGGPSSPLDFTPELANGFIFAAGVALFNLEAAAITAATVPDDTVIYTTVFGFNGSGLIDSTGAVGAIDGNTAGAGETIARDVGGAWVVQAAPSPGTGPMIPEPSTALLLGLGLAVLGARRRL